MMKEAATALSNGENRLCIHIHIAQLMLQHKKLTWGSEEVLVHGLSEGMELCLCYSWTVCSTPRFKTHAREKINKKKRKEERQKK